jgi:hypothetical protein
MVSASNVGNKSEDKQKLISALMGQGGLCHKYNDLKQNRGYADFIFPVDDIKKATQEGHIWMNYANDLRRTYAYRSFG